MKILIADDSQTIVDVVQFLLTSQGYDVVTASDGIEAISKTYQTRPDLILLDIEMPKMTGYQVCRLLKSDERTRTIPIVILTSRAQRRDRFWGLTTGADEFMTKDFESEAEFFQMIHQVLEQHGANRTEQPQRSRPDTITSPGENVPITEIAVLEKVNAILDRQLFQATIVNEVSSLVMSIHSFFSTIHSLFRMLARVCEFDMAAIFLKEQHTYRIFLYAVPQVSPQFLHAVKQRTIAAYQHHCPQETVDEAKEIIVQEDILEYKEKNASPDDEVATFLVLPLQVRNSVIGVLTLSSASEDGFSPESLETLHIFTTEASLVLDNALLYQQLEQSNRELGSTVTELKNTQSQLIQSEKMASIGQLVAGVAHEINTPAGAINAATSNLMNFLPSLVENFRHVARQNLSQEDQNTLLRFITRLLHSPAQERKSTFDIRHTTKILDRILTGQGVSNTRRIAKQIARLSLDEQEHPALIRLLRSYESEHIINFLEDCSKILNATKDIQVSIRIITRIVNALKMYSRLDQAKVEEVNIHEGIETTLIILHSQIKYGIHVEKHYGDIPAIPCYANELNQVWTNIIHNAVQAMNGEGTLTIETSFLPAGSPKQAEDADAATRDGMVRIRISDTGQGIPAEIRDKIFDPYFTTKDQGEGSGLGLGIAQQIVERHQGTIRVESQPGNTSFEIFLPVSGVLEDYLAQ